MALPKSGDFFWKSVFKKNHKPKNNICAELFENIGGPSYARSFLENEQGKVLKATIDVEKDDKGRKYIIAGWGGETYKVYKFQVPENGQIKAGDELPQTRKGSRSLVFKETPVNLNLQLLMLDN